MASMLKWAIGEHDEEIKGFGVHCLKNNYV